MRPIYVVALIMWFVLWFSIVMTLLTLFIHDIPSLIHVSLTTSAISIIAGIAMGLKGAD